MKQKHICLLYVVPRAFSAANVLLTVQLLQQIFIFMYISGQDIYSANLIFFSQNKSALAKNKIPFSMQQISFIFSSYNIVFSCIICIIWCIKMAEVVFQSLEGMLPELEDLERQDLFTREELRYQQCYGSLQNLCITMVIIPCMTSFSMLEWIRVY